ncbi:Eukaryotic translation initiation factor 2A [Blattella germanica]|nr:Eukaryotic translation initiation factor 2A [Blattella germanica]
MASNVPVVAVRGTTGISINLGPPSYDLVSAFTRDDSKSCKAMLFDPEGKYFAWVNGICVKIVATSTWKVLAEIPRPKVSNLEFSPKGSYLMTWEPFTVSQANPQGGPNLHIFKSDTGELIKDFVHKKQIGWEPQWTSDEKICARNVNNEVLFYEVPNFDTVVHKIHIQKADKVDMFWNKRGTGVLLMTSLEVDKTGSSYYGKQALHFISTKGETAMVLLSKEGPIYSVEWSPKGSEFCVVYGFMPSKATLFNLKCEPVFEFGTGPLLLILGGFGNISGNVELWDASARKLIAKMEAADTTLLQWSPDGEHFVTATTAPRLRMGNGFKIWHYSGTLLYERPWNKQEELWEVLWQMFPAGVFRDPIINYKPVEGIQPSQPQASKQAYRPPSARGRESNFKLHDDDEPASNTRSGGDSNPSKAALKQKKKREAKKAKKEQDGGACANPSATGGSVVTNGDSTTAPKLPPALADAELTGDPEKVKKIKKLKSKLVEISRLKEQRAAGRQLELNQLEKIKKEDELLKELQGLVL